MLEENSASYARSNPEMGRRGADVTKPPRMPVNIRYMTQDELKEYRSWILNSYAYLLRK